MSQKKTEVDQKTETKPKAATKKTVAKKPAAAKKATAEKKTSVKKPAAKKTEAKATTKKPAAKKTTSASKTGALLDKTMAAEMTATVKKTAKKTTPQKKTASIYISAIGRRKTSVARVYIKRGSGQILVNKKPLNTQFTETSNQYHLILKPLVDLDVMDQFDVVVRVRGGGKAGQAGAIQLGIARALDRFELTDLGLESSTHEEQLAMLPSRPWRVALKQLGLLTRDARIIERKKFGLRKARKKEQYSKR